MIHVATAAQYSFALQNVLETPQSLLEGEALLSRGRSLPPYLELLTADADGPACLVPVIGAVLPRRLPKQTAREDRSTSNHGNSTVLPVHCIRSQNRGVRPGYGATNAAIFFQVSTLGPDATDDAIGKTVETHRAHILRKLGTANMTAAVYLADTSPYSSIRREH